VRAPALVLAQSSSLIRIRPDTAFSPFTVTEVLMRALISTDSAIEDDASLEGDPPVRARLAEVLRHR
jgi:hypothetical protein